MRKIILVSLALSTALAAPVHAQYAGYPSAMATSPADQLAATVRRLAQAPTDVFALVTAGELSIKLDDMSAAAAFFARAEKVDPRNPRVKAGMAAILVRAERPGEALRYFQMAEQLGLSAQRFAADRGLALDLLGEQERAQRDYRVALRTAPADDETIRRYALSLGISGKREMALEQLEPLIRRQDRAAWRVRAFVLAMGGDVAGAGRIATTMMPPGMATGLQPFFERLPNLPAADRAFAVHFGEVRPTLARLADARMKPALAPLGPDPFPPLQVTAVQPRPVAVAQAAKKPSWRDRQRERRERRFGRGVQVAAVAPAPKPAAPQAQPPAYTGRPVALAQAAPAPRYPQSGLVLGQRPRATMAVPQSAPRSAFTPSATVAGTGAPATTAPSAGLPVQIAARPASPVPVAAPPVVPVQIAAVAPQPAPLPASVATASASTSLSAPQSQIGVRVPIETASLASNATTSPPVVAAASPSSAPTGVAAPAITAAATLTPAAPITQPTAGLAALLPAPTTVVPSPVTTTTAAQPVPASPASAPVATAAVQPAPGFTPLTPAPSLVGAEPSVLATAVPSAPVRSEDSILARIVASITVPGEELGVTAPERQEIAAATRSDPTTARTLEQGAAEAARESADRTAAARTIAATSKSTARSKAAAKPKPTDAEQEDAEPAVRKGRRGKVELASRAKPTAKEEEDVETGSSKRASDKKGKAADKTALTKKDAAKKEKDDAEDGRIWVQVAGGAQESDLPKAWAAAQRKASALKGRVAYSTPLRATNRVVTGPFKTKAEAQTFVNQLARQGVSAFQYEGGAKQKLTKLPAK